MDILGGVSSVSSLHSEEKQNCSFNNWCRASVMFIQASSCFLTYILHPHMWGRNKLKRFCSVRFCCSFFFCNAGSCGMWSVCPYSAYSCQRGILAGSVFNNSQVWTGLRSDCGVTEVKGGPCPDTWGRIRSSRVNERRGSGLNTFSSSRENKTEPLPLMLASYYTTSAAVSLWNLCLYVCFCANKYVSSAFNHFLTRFKAGPWWFLIVVSRIFAWLQT